MHVVMAMVLLVLLALPGAARAQQGPEAQLVFARNEVEVGAPELHPARAGEVLQRGHRVRTGAASAAEIALADGTTLALGEHTTLVMFTAPGPVPPGQRPSTNTTLQRGVVQIRMPATVPAEAPVVPLATASATVFAGRADVAVAADLGGHITRVAVYRGRVRIRAGAREYLLLAGSGAFEELGRPPRPLRPLLRAPAWRTLPPTRILSYGEPVEAQGEYAPGAGPRPVSWRVQVARDEAFRDILSDAVVPVGSVRWRGQALVPGVYRVRVFALDVDRFESAPSPAASMEVASLRIVPGALGPPGRRAAVEVPRGFVCGLDGAPLTAVRGPLLLAPGRAHRLRCATSERGDDARERTFSADEAAPLVHEVRVGDIRAATPGAPARGVLTVTLRDAEGTPVPWATLDVEADRGVAIEPLREMDPRGVYTATVHWPAGVRATRLRFTVNNAARFEHDATVRELAAVAAAPATRGTAPVTVEVRSSAGARDRDEE